MSHLGHLAAKILEKRHPLVTGEVTGMIAGLLIRIEFGYLQYPLHTDQTFSSILGK